MITLKCGGTAQYIVAKTSVRIMYGESPVGLGEIAPCWPHTDEDDFAAWRELGDNFGKFVGSRG